MAEERGDEGDSSRASLVDDERGGLLAVLVDVVEVNESREATCRASSSSAAVREGPSARESERDGLAQTLSLASQ